MYQVYAFMQFLEIVKGTMNRFGPYICFLLEKTMNPKSKVWKTSFPTIIINIRAQKIEEQNEDCNRLIGEMNANSQKWTWS